MAEQPNAAVKERQRPDPNEKLVKVFDSEQESEAMVVKGLLDSAGIENDLASGQLLQEAFPGLGGMIILVREEDAAKRGPNVPGGNSFLRPQVTRAGEGFFAALRRTE